MQCVEFLDSLMMRAVNQAGSAGIKYPERDSLFFSTFLCALASLNLAC